MIIVLFPLVGKLLPNNLMQDRDFPHIVGQYKKNPTCTCSRLNMKIKKSFRINEDVDNIIKNLAEENGITFSQFVELACYSMIDKEPNIENLTRKSKKQDGKKNEHLEVRLSVDSDSFLKLAKIVKSKNTTFSQEIRFRLSATLEKDIFSEQEFSKLWQVRNDLNSLGNLFRLAIKSNLPMDEKKLNEMQKLVIETKLAFDEILTSMNERML